MKLSKRQRDTLYVIADYRDEKGYSPTLAEITRLLGLSSRSSTKSIVDKLEIKGYVTKEKKQSRTILLTDKFYDELT